MDRDFKKIKTIVLEEFLFLFFEGFLQEFDEFLQLSLDFLILIL